MKKKHFGQSVLGIAAACVALAACQTAPPSATDAGDTIATRSGAKAGNGTSTQISSGVITPDATSGNGTMAAPKGRDPETGEIPPEERPFRPSMSEGGKYQHQAMVNAAEGGVLVSPDGLMKVEIPPGTLDRNTIIRMNWFDTSRLQRLEIEGMPGKGDHGILGQVDLGGARIQDGKQLMVTAPVDPRFVANVKWNDRTYDETKYGLTQTDQGVWRLSMPLKGASVSSEPDEKPTVDPFAWEYDLQAPPIVQDATVDESKLTGDPIADQAAAARKVLCSFAVIPNTAETRQATAWEGSLAGFSCTSPPNNGDGSHTLHCFVCAAVYGGKTACQAAVICWGAADASRITSCTPPPPPPPPPVYCQVKVKANWDSDDWQLNGKPAGEYTYAQFEGLTGGGNEEKPIANATGRTAKTYEEGTRVRVSVYATTPAIWGGQKTVRLNCPSGDLNFTPTKNMPKVWFSGSVGGGVKNANNTITTSQGAFTDVPMTFRKSVSIFPNNDGKTVWVNNSNYRPTTNSWVDINPSGGSIYAVWNSTHTLNYRAWYSSVIYANFRWVSNDTTRPADQMPSAANRWNLQAANGLTVKFNHAMSTAVAKPAGRDVDYFPTVSGSTQWAWGLNQASGTVNASKTTNGVPLTGTNTYRVGGAVGQGGNVGVDLTANLPVLTFKITGDLPPASTRFIMNYNLGGVPKTMTLPAPAADGTVLVTLPIEEAIGVTYKHNFEFTRIATANGAYTVQQPAVGGWPTTLRQTWRNNVLTYAPMLSIGTVAKYKVGN